MSWDHIDLTNRIWHIPKTKNGLALDVPLIDEAVDLLQRIKSKTNSEWVFSSDSKTGHYEEPKKSHKRVRRKISYNGYEIEFESM